MYRLYKDIAGIERALPHLSHADIEEALRYYQSNRVEINGYISQNDVDEDLLNEIL